MSTYPVAAPERRSLPLWLALAIGAVILALALVADAFDVRPGPIVGSHGDIPYLPSQHLTQDLGR